ncbi:MAG: alpha/beta hydrolase family protein [Pseudomonadota bacterium]
MIEVVLKVYRAALLGRLRRLLDRHWNPYQPLPKDTYLSPSLGISEALAAAPRAMGFDSQASEDPAAWQSRARKKLIELTGYTENRDQPQITTEIPAEEVDPGLLKRSFYLRVRPATDLPVHLIFREGLSAPAPVFLHLAGSTSGVHLAWGSTRVPIDHQRVTIGADMARQAAERGYLAVAIEQAGYGERTEFHLPKRSSNRTIDTANHLLLLGRTLMGDGASDMSSAVDWLLGSHCPFEVLPNRIFLFGHSAGGTLAQFAAALDTRIAGILASGSVGPICETLAARGAGGGDGIVPGLLNYFDTADLIALVAPRPFVGLSGKSDHIYPYNGVEQVITEAAEFYRLMGAESSIRAVAVNGPHQYHPLDSWRAWHKWIDLWPTSQVASDRAPQAARNPPSTGSSTPVI